MRRLALGLAALALLAGCTTIPSSSSPQVVRTVPKADNSQATEPDTGPTPGAAPGDLMREFDQAELAAEGGHSQARQYLSSTASRKWQDDTTVILDETIPGEPVFSSDTSAVITVTGRRVGAIDATGVYSPTLKGSGTGDEEAFTYTLSKHAGEWRIDSLPAGTVISAADFRADFRPRKVYFFDSTGAILVPDIRYTSLEGQSLATWLLQRLQDGPRPELGHSVVSDLPDQPSKATVVVGDPIAIDVQGSQQIMQTMDGNALAAQLAFTLGQVTFTNGKLQLSDGGRLVSVPSVSGATFSAADFGSVDPDAQTGSADAYFIRDGVLYTATGDPYNVDHQQVHDLTSVAVRRISSAGIQLAAVSRAGRLLVGDPQHLTAVKLAAAPTSRPEWSPQGDDVWVAAGSSVFRVTSGQAPHLVSLTTLVGGPPTGQVTAVRFSPDGVRVALVIRSSKGPGTLWIGSVVTSGSDIRIDSLQPITPPGISVNDVAWADQTRLYLISAAQGGSAGVSEVLSDGSQLATEGAPGLPASPTSIADAPGENPIVSANGVIAELSHGAWVNIKNNKDAQAGTNPVYAY